MGESGGRGVGASPVRIWSGRLFILECRDGVLVVDLHEGWLEAMMTGLVCQYQSTLFVVVSELAWLTWCCGEGVASSTGDGGLIRVMCSWWRTQC